MHIVQVIFALGNKKSYLKKTHKFYEFNFYHHTAKLISFIKRREQKYVIRNFKLEGFSNLILNDFCFFFFFVFLIQNLF